MGLPKGMVYSATEGKFMPDCYIVVISEDKLLANGLRHILTDTSNDSLEDIIADYYCTFSNCNDKFYPFATMDEVNKFISSLNGN